MGGGEVTVTYNNGRGGCFVKDRHLVLIVIILYCFQPHFQAGANWKLRNHRGETAMDLAMEMGRADILELFLEEGIDVLPKTSHPTR